MTPIEELRKGFDELGVEYDTYDLPNGEHGLSWIDSNDIEWEVVQQGENFRIHALQLVTPEQAIAATVGAGTCRCTVETSDDYYDDYTRYHMSCGFTMYGDGIEKPRFCGGCGKRIEEESE